MPIYSPHHVIPDVLRRIPHSTTTTTIANTTRITATATTTTTTQAPPGYGVESLGTYAYISLVALLLLLVAVSVLLIMGYRSEAEFKEGVKGTPGTGFRASYSYDGVKALLRRAFLSMRSFAERRAGLPLTSKTVFEVSRLLGAKAWGIAKRYAFLMYSKHNPSSEEVELLEKDIEELTRE